MKNENQSIICDNCGRPGARLRHVSEAHGSGADILVIDHIPMVSCPHCGESYFEAETLREIEQLKLNRHALATERAVEVLSYS